MSRVKHGIPNVSSRLILLVILVAGLLGVSAPPALAADPPYTPPQPGEALRFACGPDGTQSSGAKYRICMPSWLPWNRDLLVYAHGYVAPNKPIAIPEDQLRLPDGTYIPDLAGFLGYAFATTSYSVNGLAVKQGMADLVDLVRIFRAGHPTLRRVILIGPSEGGLITTLQIERRPDVFDGGLATCGPIGDFRQQINHIADFRVVFDYLFPGVMPGTVIDVPEELLTTWDDFYRSDVLPVILRPASAISVTQLLSVTHAAIDPEEPEMTISDTVEILLWYNVFGSADAAAKLGGQPFDNMARVYAGSLDDARLNAAVQRYAAAPAALAEMEQYYQTGGSPHVPLVTLHTTLDPIVPYWHHTMYRTKIQTQSRTAWHQQFTAARYGHCNFTVLETQNALNALLAKVGAPPGNAYLPMLLK
jgi:hypothetical protein